VSARRRGVSVDGFRRTLPSPMICPRATRERQRGAHDRAKYYRAHSVAVRAALTTSWRGITAAAAAWARRCGGCHRGHVRARCVEGGSLRSASSRLHKHGVRSRTRIRMDDGRRRNLASSQTTQEQGSVWPARLTRGCREDGSARPAQRPRPRQAARLRAHQCELPRG